MDIQQPWAGGMLRIDINQTLGDLPDLRGAPTSSGFVDLEKQELWCLELEMQRSLVLKVSGWYGKDYRFMGRDWDLKLDSNHFDLTDSREISRHLELLRSFRKRILVKIALAVHRNLDRSRLVKSTLVTGYLWWRTALWSIRPSLRQKNYGSWIKKFDSHDLFSKDELARAQASGVSLGVVLWNSSPKAIGKWSRRRFLKTSIKSAAQSLIRPKRLGIMVEPQDAPYAEALANKYGLSAPIIWKKSARFSENFASLKEMDCDYLFVVSSDGELSRVALARFALWIQKPQASGARIFYGDRDRFNLWGKRCEPQFHPDWSFEYLIGQNVFSHFAILHRQLLEVGATDFKSWWDFISHWTLIANASEIGHVPHILFHAKRLDPSAHNHEWISALRTSVEAKFPGARLDSGPHQVPIIAWPCPSPLPKVSVIIPTRDRAHLLQQVIEGLIKNTDYSSLEILIVDNDSRELKTKNLYDSFSGHPNVKILPLPGKFNFSASNNLGFRHATGEVIALLNNDLEIISSSWLKNMVCELMRPDVGIVGAKLLYKNGFIQHAGVILGPGQVSCHISGMEHGRSRGYCDRLSFPQSLSAVTAACLLIRRETFEKVGGLDEKKLAVAYNDVDLCLKVKELGLKVIWTPLAELYHLESASRSHDRNPGQIPRYQREVEYVRRRWAKYLSADPSYNPNLSNCGGNFQLADPPRFPVDEMIVHENFTL